MKHTKELFSLDGKVAIVTGGRGLYGASISYGLCEMGASVVIASRNGAKCDEFAAELREKGYEAVGMSLDLGDDASIRQLVKDVIARYGKIDILVNNAVDRSNMVSLNDATREKLQGIARSDEDVLSYIAFPNLAEKFFEERKEKEENMATYTIVEA